MNVGTYSGVSGMRSGTEYQQILAENLSLQAVPGYREIIPVFSTDPRIGSEEAANSTSSGNPAAVSVSRVINFSQGPLQPSGSPYHVAIQGNTSFFGVKEANGATTYTRDGEFTLSPEGQLQTADGAAVLGQGGSTLTIDTSKSSNVTIGTDGTITVGGSIQGQLDATHFLNPAAVLQAADKGRFSVNDPSQAISGLAAGDQMKQGYLEQSNGNAVLQMASMINVMRIYEANQKSIQGTDDTQAKLISTLGTKPS